MIPLQSNDFDCGIWILAHFEALGLHAWQRAPLQGLDTIYTLVYHHIYFDNINFSLSSHICIAYYWSRDEWNLSVLWVYVPSWVHCRTIWPDDHSCLLYTVLGLYSCLVYQDDCVLLIPADLWLAILSTLIVICFVNSTIWMHLMFTCVNTAPYVLSQRVSTLSTCLCGGDLSPCQLH